LHPITNSGRLNCSFAIRLQGIFFRSRFPYLLPVVHEQTDGIEGKRHEITSTYWISGLLGTHGDLQAANMLNSTPADKMKAVKEFSNF